jgi:hypothetical protein
MAQDFVGTKRWIRPATPYEIYMEEQIFRSIAARWGSTTSAT